VLRERLALPTSTAPPTDYPDHSFRNHLPEPKGPKRKKGPKGYFSELLLMEIFV
jgi:hypothetical protein